MSVLAGCGEDDGRAAGSDEALASVERYTVEQALRDLAPASSGGAEPVFVATGDIAWANAFAGLPEPVDPRSSSTWVRGLLASPIGIRLDPPLSGINAAVARDTVGFDARDLRSFATLFQQDEDIVVVNLDEGSGLKEGVSATGAGEVGDIDPAPAEQAVFNYVLGADQQGSAVALTQYPDSLDRWSDRGRESLADDQQLLEVARALDDEGVHAAYLVNSVPENRPDLVQQAAGQTSMPRFGAAAAGQAVRDGKEAEVAAYYFDDAEAAKDVVEEVWRNGTSVGGIGPLADVLDVDDVSVVGNIVVVRITPQPSSPGVALNLIGTGDVPFAVLE